MSGAADRARAVVTLAGGTDTAPDGLDGLFRSEAPRLQRYFRQKTGDREVASDLVQDTFVKMVSAYDVGLGNPAAYLQRIARNLVFDRFRRAKRSVAEAEIPLDDCDAAVLPMQEQDLTARDLLRLYETAIEGLSSKTRTVFLLSRVEGLTYDEIRNRLGISMGTVEYHMMRALSHIDRVLEER
jgi:RNA polymerase sigma-70 factor (ECF subfamily)